MPGATAPGSRARFGTVLPTLAGHWRAAFLTAPSALTVGAAISSTNNLVAAGGREAENRARKEPPMRQVGSPSAVHATASGPAGLESLRAPLMRFFMRRLRDRAQAEDYTQECLARMVAVGEREDVDDPEAFVFRIALNLLIEEGRRRARRAQQPFLNADHHRISEATREFVEDRTPERVLEGKQTVAAVIAALDELGSRTRDIYVLFRLEKMKQYEIAEQFGISVSTVEKEVMKATLHLAIRFGRKR